MKKFRHYWTVMIIAAGFFAVSCDDTDEVEIDPTDTTTVYDVTLEVDGAQSKNVNYTVTSASPAFISARIHFTGEGMKRLYITSNAMGMGDVIYKPSELNNSSFKADESVGLEASTSKEFDFKFELPVPDSITEGTLVYTFWATSGNGDFRDQNKRLAVGPGTITLNYGGSNVDQDELALKSFDDVKLFAPLADGSSLTFVSLVDGQVYKINQGVEYASQWDFGYYYTNAAHASLTSTANYETAFPFVDVDAIAGEAELNSAFFAKSELSADDFAAAEISGDLDFSTPANQVVSGLEEGDVVEFVDNYGKRGLIYVEEIAEGTGSQSYIIVDIKVQP